MLCSTHVYVCLYVCKVYICVHTTPKHIPHTWTLSGMVISINIIFPENTEQYVMLSCRCQMFVHPDHGQVQETLGRITKNVSLI